MKNKTDYQGIPPKDYWLCNIPKQKAYKSRRYVSLEKDKPIKKRKKHLLACEDLVCFSCGEQALLYRLGETFCLKCDPRAIKKALNQHNKLHKKINK